MSFNDQSVNVQIGAQIADLQAGMQDAASAVSQATSKIGDDLNQMRKSAETASNATAKSVNKAADQIKTGMGGTAYTLQSLGRIISDLPYGFVGIGNNIQPAADAFSRLSQQTGGAGAAVKALIGTLGGPMGLAMVGVPIVTSLALAFGDKLGPALGFADESVKRLEASLKGLDQYKNFRLQVQVIGMEGLQRAKLLLQQINEEIDIANKIKHVRAKMADATSAGAYISAMIPGVGLQRLAALRKAEQEQDALYRELGKNLINGGKDYGDALNREILKALKYSDRAIVELIDSNRRKFKQASAMADVDIAQVSEWDKQLKHQKASHKMSEQEEVAYWSNILKTQNMGAAAQEKVREKIDDAMSKGNGRSHRSTAKSDMSNFEQELMKQKATHEMSLQEEAAYWSKILTQQKLSAADRERVETKLAQTRLEISKRNIKDTRALSIEEIAVEEARALDEMALERQKLDTKLALDEINNKEYLQQLAQFEAQRYQIELTAQDKRVELAKLDPSNPLQLQKDLNRRAQLYRAHMKEMGAITSKMTIEERSKWQDLNKSISKGLGNAFGDWMVGLNGTMDMFKSMLRTLQQSFSNVIGNMVSKWIEGQLQMLVSKQTTDAASTASTAANSVATTAAKAAEATGVVTANAAEAASGAAASQASIPFVGPEMAAVAFASTMALVLGAMKLFSASGGYDIPSGVNPMTQLHAREMVLPAHLADNVRNMTGDGNGGQTIHFNVNAVDGQSVRRFFNQHKTELMKAMRDATRNGSHLGLRPTS